MKNMARALGILMVMVSLLLTLSSAYATIPDTINYQGYLNDSEGNPVNGAVTMIFSIYTGPTGGTALWSETQSVTVNEGVYNVILGTVNQTLGNLNFDLPYFLGVTVGTDFEMAPRQPLTSVAYAFTADNALDLVCSSCVSSSDVDTTAIQRRVTGTCGAGSSIRIINQDGTVSCETDDTGGAPSNTVTTLDGSSAPGAASEYSRGDHKHGIGTGAITTTHIQNNTIMNGDINTSAAISGTKLASDGSVMKSLVAGTNISVVNNNNGAWTVNAKGIGNDWSLTGNAGTTPGTNFIGTTDNQAFEVRVNNTRALHIEPNAESPNIIGGYSGNAITAGIYGATIGGGGTSSDENRVTDDYGTIGGGRSNQAGNNAGTGDDALYATVGGGNLNQAGDIAATVCGGYNNQAIGYKSTVAGGNYNEASGSVATISGGDGNVATGTRAMVGGGLSNMASSRDSTIAGGNFNAASGVASTVPGGQNNEAAGNFSLAAGHRAKANHEGAFVWADSADVNFASDTADQFAVRASGGMKFETNKITVKTAKSYLWISGNGVRKFHDSDSTVIDMTNFGGAVVQRGATTGPKNVMFPITIMGPLYGQDVKITRVDIYWKGQTEFDAVTAVLMRRQTGVCTSSSCYAIIISDSTDHACVAGVFPEGCTITLIPTTNNILTADSGILYMTLELGFNSATSQIWIGGVRLTLEHS